jgi:hypothetical protein
MITIRNRYWEILIKAPYKVVLERPDTHQPKYWVEANGEVYILIISSGEILAHKVEHVGSENFVGNTPLGKIATVKKLPKQ